MEVMWLIACMCRVDFFDETSVLHTIYKESNSETVQKNKKSRKNTINKCIIMMVMKEKL